VVGAIGKELCDQLRKRVSSFAEKRRDASGALDSVFAVEAYVPSFHRIFVA
jgi:hypothetical protein